MAALLLMCAIVQCCWSEGSPQCQIFLLWYRVNKKKNLLECIFQDDFFVWPSVSDMFWQMIAVDYKSQEKKWAFTCLDRWVTKTGSVNVETVQEKEKEKLSKRKRKATIQCNDTSNGLLHRHNTLLSLNLIEQGQTRYYLGTLPGLITNWFDNSCC